MRKSYLAILGVTLLVGWFDPRFTSLPLGLSLTLGSSAVLVLHRIVFAKFGPYAPAAEVVRLSVSLIGALFSAEGEAESGVLTTALGERLLRELKASSSFRFWGAVVKALGPLPCWPGFLLISDEP
jgi:hypothetical protein